jgi:hypothetical protein
MLEEVMNAHLTELKVSSRKIEHRAAWEQVSRIERLERALKSARGRMSVLPTFSARTN